MEKNKRGDKILWQDMTRPEFEAAVVEGATVVVPIGSIEQHGPHLPVNHDTNNAYEMALETARRAEGMRIIVAPPLWLGYSRHHMGFAGTITVDLQTFQQIVMQVCKSIWHHGFRHVFILNGHGGNTAPIAAACQELAIDGVFVATATWWNLIANELVELGESEIGGMGHACEAETSLAMYLQPDLVDLEARVKEVDQPLIPQAQNDFRLKGPVTVASDFRLRTKHGVVGDSTLATMDKGKRIFEATVASLGAVLIEYSRVER